ncbi:fatty acid desaturase [Gymnodinialimonas ceratoperidinii]|uniref:Fatty acid desaturase n=1 Tax=Gymnodinialimonas ceratoperidinii TaxID=2856823 RepID=A0A8F6U081_9RHOB|nr:fatty acid desaturase [Gymnodinialimonas ceratoperidinii]QXT40951.1 fatty acid desaturase [Gymnodinialimonas ceratoperidinii]
MQTRWPTFALISACYATWLAVLFLVPWVGAAILLLIPLIALQSSLQHEVMHGHPFASRRASEALVIGSLNLAIPYLRFRDTHLAHHRDASLTDPYDDPESNYLDPRRFARLPRALQGILRANNTLAGRMLLGPLLGQVSFMLSDARAFRTGQPGVARAWAIHALVSAAIVALVIASPTPLWAYAIACYGALSLLKIRTFLEHQAHARARGRTVIIEDRGPLAFLFLNNNFHVVHHMHPRVPWYRLPRLYAANRQKYLRCNDGYRYANYAQIFRQHLWRAKDPVTHPLYPQE